MLCEHCQSELPPGATQCPDCGAPAPEGGTGAAGDWQAEVKRLMATGQKIEAIKVYREATGVGLAEAKSAVESGLTDVQAAAPALSHSPEQFEQEIVRRLTTDGTISTIKWVRDQTRMGLKDSKDLVDQIAAKNGVTPKAGGCFGLVLLAVTVSATAASLGLALLVQG